MCDYNNNRITQSHSRKTKETFNRFRQGIFLLPLPVRFKDLPPELVDEYDYLLSVNIPRSNCTCDMCIIFQGIVSNIIF